MYFFNKINIIYEYVKYNRHNYYFRQPEFIGSKEINNGLNKHILPENTDNINSKKKQLFNSSFNNIQSSSCGSKRINSIMPNKYKTSISLPKVLSKLSVVESSKNKSNPQLESEQYISIFNRYQVFILNKL